MTPEDRQGGQDGPPVPSDDDGPSVALLLAGSDRDLVAAELERDHDVLPPTDGVPDAFDVAVIDERALDAHGEALDARTGASETFLPVLCLLPPGTDPSPDLWDRVDDVATRPVSRHELRSRIASLLDARRLSVELQRRGDRLEQVGSVLAHDIRNPLAIAAGYVDSAVETGDVDKLDPAVGALDRIDRLIDDVLALAREGRESLDVTVVDLGATADAAWSSVETDDATLRLPDDPVRVEADESRLRELLENLFRNSVEHGSTGSRSQTDDSVEHGSTGNRTESGDSVEHGSTDSRAEPGDSVEGGGVTVTVGGLDDGFYVADDGPGIPGAERERVFDRGYTTGGGTGLGLAIVTRVADLHGWTVAVTDAEGGGARFEFGGARAPMA